MAKTREEGTGAGAKAVEEAEPGFLQGLELRWWVGSGVSQRGTSSEGKQGVPPTGAQPSNQAGFQEGALYHPARPGKRGEGKRQDQPATEKVKKMKCWL